jgi:hypothetical protein
MTLRFYVSVTAAVAFLLAACGGPPLRLSSESSKIIVDLQKLGEYGSNVARLRITDVQENRVIWEIVGNDQPQLGQLHLYIGENSSTPNDIRHGNYQVVVPGHEKSFRLERGKEYRVEAWSRDHAPRCRTEGVFRTS